MVQGSSGIGLEVVSREDEKVFGEARTVLAEVSACPDVAYQQAIKDLGGFFFRFFYPESSMRGFCSLFLSERQCVYHVL